MVLAQSNPHSLQKDLCTNHSQLFCSLLAPSSVCHSSHFMTTRLKLPWSWQEISELNYSFLIPHHSPLTPHPSPLIPHPSPLTTHHSPLTPHPSPLTPHPSPLAPRPSPLTTHHSPLTLHHLPLTPHHSPLTSLPHSSPLTSPLITHHSSLTLQPSPLITYQSYLITYPELFIPHLSLVTPHAPLLTLRYSIFIPISSHLPLILHKEEKEGAETALKESWEVNSAQVELRTVTWTQIACKRMLYFRGF